MGVWYMWGGRVLSGGCFSTPAPPTQVTALTMPPLELSVLNSVFLPDMCYE